MTMPPGVKGMLSAALLMLAGCQAVPEPEPSPLFVFKEDNVPVLSIIDLEQGQRANRIDLPSRGGASLHRLHFLVDDTLHAIEYRSGSFPSQDLTDVVWLDVAADSFIYAFSLPGQAQRVAVSDDRRIAYGIYNLSDEEAGELAPYYILPFHAPRYENWLRTPLASDRYPHRYDVDRLTESEVRYTQRLLFPHRTYLTPDGGLLVVTSSYFTDRIQRTINPQTGRPESRSESDATYPVRVILGREEGRPGWAFEDSTASSDFPHFVSSPDQRYLYYTVTRRTDTFAGDRLLRQYDRQTKTLRTLRRSSAASTLEVVFHADSVGAHSYFFGESDVHFVHVDRQGTLIRHDSVRTQAYHFAPYQDDLFLGLEPRQRSEQDDDRMIDGLIFHYIDAQTLDIVRHDTVAFSPMSLTYFGDMMLIAGPPTD
ncbi:MAG: hypothetical protein AAF970_01720 [Bacteroidota bacterium]